MKIKNCAVVLISLVLMVSVFVYYRYAKEAMQSNRLSEVAPAVLASKAVDAEVSYEVPGGKIDNLRFVVTVDSDGAIEDIQTLDADTGQVPEKKKEFNGQVNVILKGKNIRELTAIDKVGESSLTTAAFNEALPKLQAAL